LENDKFASGCTLQRSNAKKEWYEVVGVVSDMGFPGDLREPYTRYEAFIPMAQSAPGYLTIALRTSATPEAIGNSLRSAVAGLDSSLPVYRVRTAATPWTRDWEIFRYVETCWAHLQR